MNVFDSILLVFIDKLNQDQIELDEMDYLFNSNNQFRDYFLKTVWEMNISESVYVEGHEVVLEELLHQHPELGAYQNHMVSNIKMTEPGFYKSEKSHDRLFIPAINMLFLVTRKPELINKLFVLFKNELEPFKEVYLQVSDTSQKVLVHGLDLCSVTHLSIDQMKEKTALNIRSLEQFYIFTVKANQKNQSYKMETWHYDKNILFDISYDDLFLRNQESFNKPKKIMIESSREFVFKNRPVLDIKAANISMASHHEMIEFTRFFQYKIEKNEIDFQWDVEKVLQLIASPNRLTSLGDKKVLRNILLNHPECLTTETMTMLCLKERGLFKYFQDMIDTQKIEIKPAIINMPAVKKEEMEKAMVDKSLINWKQYIEKITEIIRPYDVSDNAIYEAWKKLEKQTEFLITDKSVEYFSHNPEDRITFEQMLANYIPTILSNYFNIPEHVRNNEKNAFTRITTEQIETIESEMQRIEVRVLEEDLRKMKGFARFLGDRLPDPEKKIFTI